MGHRGSGATVAVSLRWVVGVAEAEEGEDTAGVDEGARPRAPSGSMVLCEWAGMQSSDRKSCLSH